jgi:predicted glycosyltransferase
MTLSKPPISIGFNSFQARLITGPLFANWLRLDLAADFSVVPFDPELTTTLAAADLVICQAGYNTTAELKQIEIRVIIVPGERRWDDQFARAERVRETGQPSSCESRHPPWYGIHRTEREKLRSISASC